MAQSVFSVRMEEELKRQFDALCSDFGMNASTAFNIFARAVVREKKIPFEISVAKPEVTREAGLNAFMELRNQARMSGLQDMTLEDINKEIYEARKG
jgi:addiction module RelB/DinJ family antitoxin